MALTYMKMDLSEIHAMANYFMPITLHPIAPTCLHTSGCARQPHNDWCESTYAVVLCRLQTVVLDSAVDPESAANKGNVERWLLELEAMQWKSVRTQVTLSLKEYPTIPREQWVLHWPAQAVLGVSQVNNTTMCGVLVGQRCLIRLESPKRRHSTKY